MISKWYTKAQNANTVPMTEDVTRMLMTLIMNGDEIAGRINDGSVASEQLKNDFRFQMFSKRSEALGLDIDIPSIIFMSQICKTPGEVSMYVSYLKLHQIQNKDFIILGSICSIFPYGFWEDKALNMLWDAQKHEGRNLVDDFEIHHAFGA